MWACDRSSTSSTTRGSTRVKRKVKPLSSLERRHRESAPLVAESLRELRRPAEDLGWLPVKHSRGFWTALVDRRSGYPVKYLPIDPY